MWNSIIALWYQKLTHRDNVRWRFMKREHQKKSVIVLVHVCDTHTFILYYLSMTHSNWLVYIHSTSFWYTNIYILIPFELGIFFTFINNQYKLHVNTCVCVDDEPATCLCPILVGNALSHVDVNGFMLYRLPLSLISLPLYYNILHISIFVDWLLLLTICGNYVSHIF